MKEQLPACGAANTEVPVEPITLSIPKVLMEVDIVSFNSFNDDVSSRKVTIDADFHFNLPSVPTGSSSHVIAA
jgi:hypothetical protein